MLNSLYPVIFCDYPVITSLLLFSTLSFSLLSVFLSFPYSFLSPTSSLTASTLNQLYSACLTLSIPLSKFWTNSLFYSVWWDLNPNCFSQSLNSTNLLFFLSPVLSSCLSITLVFSSLTQPNPSMRPVGSLSSLSLNYLSFCFFVLLWQPFVCVIQTFFQFTVSLEWPYTIFASNCFQLSKFPLNPVA